MIRPEDYGALGDGATDDLAAFQAALAAASAVNGGEVTLTTGAFYRLSATLSIPACCGIVGPRSATLLAPVADFNNATLNRYGSNAAVLDLSGVKSSGGGRNVSPFLHGFTIYSPPADGRLVDAIVAHNVLDLHISDIEIQGFPVGCDIRAGSLMGGVIRNCYFHNRSDDSAWSGASGPPQLTAIEIDNDRYNGGSLGTLIQGNFIKDITVGSTFNAAWGYQTDGINVASNQASDLVISDNVIVSTGEGIDFWGVKSALTGNVIRSSYNFGIKLIHGASRNAITGGVVDRAGFAGITVAGTNAPGLTAARGNTITGVSIADINFNSAWSSYSTACIKIDTGSAFNVDNTTVTGCTLDEGANGKYGWIDSSPSGAGNYGEGLKIFAGGSNIKRIYSPNGGAVRLAGSTTYQTTLV